LLGLWTFTETSVTKLKMPVLARLQSVNTTLTRRTNERVEKVKRLSLFTQL